MDVETARVGITRNSFSIYYRDCLLGHDVVFKVRLLCWTCLRLIDSLPIMCIGRFQLLEIRHHIPMYQQDIGKFHVS